MNDDGALNQKPVLTFVLIHGTFGLGASWVVSDAAGSFRDQLRQEFSSKYDVRFEVVDWGESSPLKRLCRDNTLAKRFKGAAKLAQHLSKCDDISDGNRRYLIAHSHGGSVVMYAMTNPKILNKVSGIVCLSSPFLKYRAAEFDRDLLFFSIFILIVIAIKPGSVLLWTYTVIYTIVAGIVLVSHNSSSKNSSDDKLKKHNLRVKIPAKEDLRNAMGPIPFLAVRPHRDEVTILFWFTQHTGRAFRGLWQFVNTVWRWALGGFIAVRGIQWGIETWLPQIETTALNEAMSVIDQEFMTPIMVIATVVLLGMALTRLFYALDALPWLASLDPHPKIVPWEDADAIAVDTFGFFAHTSIQLQAPAKIIDWIQSSHRVNPDSRIPSSTVPDS